MGLQAKPPPASHESSWTPSTGPPFLESDGCRLNCFAKIQGRVDAWERLSRRPGAGDIKSPEVEKPSPKSLFYSNVLNLGEYGFQGMPTHNAGFDQYALVRDCKF